MNIWLQKLLAFVLLFTCLPLLFFLFILVKITSKGPFIYKQKRAGINRKPFVIYKIRTMINNAENIKNKYEKLNEADGPVFKIRNDPRYTKVGKILSHVAIDELPQLINVLRGEMALVGPRPLPLKEAKLIPSKYNERFSVLPGMTSTWVIQGGHKLSFKQWMDLDVAYAKNKSLSEDVIIFYSTIKSSLINVFKLMPFSLTPSQ